MNITISVLPSAWSVDVNERGWMVYNDHHGLMLFLPPSLTPDQVRECAWLHYTAICGGGVQ